MLIRGYSCRAFSPAATIKLRKGRRRALSRRKCLISAGIFILLTLVKLLVPGTAQSIRAQAQKILCHDTDYTQVLLYISSIIPEKEEPQPESTPVPTPTADVPLYVPQNLRSVQRTHMPEVKTPASEELTQSVQSRMSDGVIAEPEPAPEPEPEPEPLPEAVRTFLDAQAEYSDYELPANVSYLMPELPFSYTAPVSGYESSGFGYRLHPIQDEVKFHYGTDMAAWSGEPVYAFADGTVTFAAYSDSFGNYITIDHGDGWQSLYAHCSRLDVQSGQSVSCGEQIALVGATGLVTGPHLHFELTRNGVYINPEYYINYTWQA